MTPGFATSTRLDLNQIGEARNSMLGIKLDQVIFLYFVSLVCTLGIYTETSLQSSGGPIMGLLINFVVYCLYYEYIMLSFLGVRFSIRTDSS